MGVGWWIFIWGLGRQRRREAEGWLETPKESRGVKVRACRGLSWGWKCSKSASGLHGHLHLVVPGRAICCGPTTGFHLWHTIEWKVILTCVLFHRSTVWFCLVYFLGGGGRVVFAWDFLACTVTNHFISWVEIAMFGEYCCAENCSVAVLCKFLLLGSLEAAAGGSWVFLAASSQYYNFQTFTSQASVSCVLCLWWPQCFSVVNKP